MVFPLWNLVVGPKISMKAHPYRLENGVLKVVVNNSTWMQQLSFMKEQIIKGYLEMTGEELVKDIKFFTGKKNTGNYEKNRDELSRKIKPDNSPDEFQLKRMDLPEETLNSIKENVKYIKDENLQKQIYNLIETDMKSKKWQTQMGWKKCPACEGPMEPDDNICMICDIKKGSK